MMVSPAVSCVLSTASLHFNRAENIFKDVKEAWFWIVLSFQVNLSWELKSRRGKETIKLKYHTQEMTENTFSAAFL